MLYTADWYRVIKSAKADWSPASAARTDRRSWSAEVSAAFGVLCAVSPAMSPCIVAAFSSGIGLPFMPATGLFAMVVGLVAAVAVAVSVCACLDVLFVSSGARKPALAVYSPVLAPNLWRNP